MKTAYIFNILKFITWPGATVEDKTTPVRIVVVGQDPVGDLLEELAKSALEGRTLKVEHCTDETNLASEAHIVFISRSMEQHLPDIVQNYQGKIVLTISDIRQFSRRGGIIGFFQDRGRIKIEINLRMARELGFKIDARLLEIARIIQ
ncbi:MAG TPA: YfiR family protein [Candidatus Ozemobacteraceae bacterium]|nr:YfiR family protein [Candidatus Ozemobacteraceae bacterium]